jgi:hypothetical protein
MDEVELNILTLVFEWLNGTLDAHITVGRVLVVPSHDGGFEVVSCETLPGEGPIQQVVDVVREPVQIRPLKIGWHEDGETYRLPIIYAGYGKETKTLLIGEVVTREEYDLRQLALARTLHQAWAAVVDFEE